MPKIKEIQKVVQKLSHEQESAATYEPVQKHVTPGIPGWLKNNSITELLQIDCWCIILAMVIQNTPIDCYSTTLIAYNKQHPISIDWRVLVHRNIIGTCIKKVWMKNNTTFIWYLVCLTWNKSINCIFQLRLLLVNITLMSDKMVDIF